MTVRKLLWVSHIVPYPPKAGVLLRAYNLLKGVGARHQVKLVAFVQEIWLQTHFGSTEAGLVQCQAALGEFCESVEFLPIESLQRPSGRYHAALAGLWKSGGYMAQWLQAADAHRYFENVARAEKFDLVHLDTIALAPYRKHFFDIPATLGHHNIESHMLLRRGENEGNAAKKLYFRREGRRLEDYERRVAAEYSMHITCSDVDSARLSAISPESHIETIPNGVDCDFFKPSGCVQIKSSIIFVGTMNWYPNVDAMMFFLRNVWPKLKRQRPELVLEIVGANPPGPLVEIANRLSDVRLRGFVDDIRPMIEAAALFVCPIRDGGGTKLKVLDAFAMQKCMVAHPIACEGIEVTDGLDVVFAEEPEEWIRTITLLLDDFEERARIGTNARKLAQGKYSFDAIAGRLAGLFDDVVGHATRAGSSSSLR